MIQKRFFKSILLALFFLNSNFILAQNETYWAVTNAFPIKNPHLDSTYKSTAEKVQKEIKSLIIQNGKTFLWTNCFSEIEESIKDKDCNPVKLPKDYQNIELVGDSLLYIKLPLQNGKEFFLIYQKLGKEMPQSEILKYENTYLSNKDSLILFIDGNKYLKIEHYFKDIYIAYNTNKQGNYNFYARLFVENGVLTLMSLASNENSFPEIASSLAYYGTQMIIIEESLKDKFEKSDIEDFVYYCRRKYSTWYFKLNQR